MSRHDPHVAMRHMLEHAREAREYAMGHRRDDLDSDRSLHLILTRLVEIIGEAARRPHYRFDVPHSPRSGRGFLAPDEVRGCEQTPPLKPRTGRRSHRSSPRNALQHASYAPLGLCPSSREPRPPRTSSGARNRRPRCGLSTNPAAHDLGSDLAIALEEAARRVPPNIRERYPSVPWKQIVGTRDRLIHGYDVVNNDVLWSIVSNDLPPLIGALEVILGSSGG